MQNIEEQRKSINKSITKMLSICKSQLQKATEAFVTHDSDLAEKNGWVRRCRPPGASDRCGRHTDRCRPQADF